jgi:Spy/CpxP family protein refolding chaperone
MRTAAASLLLLIPLAFVSCQSSDYDEPTPATYPRGGGRGRGGEGMTRPRGESGVLDMLPPSDWWRDPQLANAVNLSADQVAALEKISKEQGDELEKLERDAGVSLRDLRSLLDSEKPSEADIIAAGNRVREMRDTIFDRQLKMLAGERALLTKQQWQTLQDQLETRRTERGGRDRGGYPGRGGFPGRGGRRPGFPG